MYISPDFVDAQGLKTLFPNTTEDRISELFNAGCFGPVTRFSGADVVDRREAERAARIIFGDSTPKQKSENAEPKNAEPEKPKYSPTDQAMADNATNIINRFGKSGMDQDRYRVLCATKTLAKLEAKYNPPAIDKKAIQKEIETLEQQKEDLMKEAAECHKTHTPVPARTIDHTIGIKRRILELQKKL